VELKKLLAIPHKIGAYLEFEKVGYEKFKDGCDSAADNFWEKIKERSLTCVI
jgi:hypothetical protein